MPEPEFGSERFIFDVEEMFMFVLVEELGFWKRSYRGKENVGVVFMGRNSVCLVISEVGVLGIGVAGVMLRPEYQDTVDRFRARIEQF